MLQLDDYDSDYEALIKRKKNRNKKEIKRLRILAIEMFKTLNNMNQSYIKTYLILKEMLRFAQMTSQLGIIKLLATTTRI